MQTSSSTTKSTSESDQAPSPIQPFPARVTFQGQWTRTPWRITHPSPTRAPKVRINPGRNREGTTSGQKQVLGDEPGHLPGSGRPAW